jgi:hypothetical protein
MQQAIISSNCDPCVANELYKLTCRISLSSFETTEMICFVNIICFCAPPVPAVLHPLRYHRTEPHKKPRQQISKPLLTAAAAAAAAGSARVVIDALVPRPLLLASLQQRVRRSGSHQALLLSLSAVAAAAAARGLADALLLLLLLLL